MLNTGLFVSTKIREKSTRNREVLLNTCTLYLFRSPVRLALVKKNLSQFVGSIRHDSKENIYREFDCGRVLAHYSFDEAAKSIYAH